MARGELLLLAVSRGIGSQRSFVDRIVAALLDQPGMVSSAAGCGGSANNGTGGTAGDSLTSNSMHHRGRCFSAQVHGLGSTRHRVLCSRDVTIIGGLQCSLRHSELEPAVRWSNETNRRGPRGRNAGRGTATRSAGCRGRQPATNADWCGSLAWFRDRREGVHWAPGAAMGVVRGPRAAQVPGVKWRCRKSGLRAAMSFRSLPFRSEVPNGLEYCCRTLRC
jgi:hypothetical protein